tara:strand:- start:767 stop:1087 length:321 start_codon:yes stop_codon:yes gene_type:complete
MNDFTNMLSQAKKMQDKMKEVQESIKKIEVEGSSGGNSVRVVLNGDYEMKSIFIDENTQKEKNVIVKDLIIAAYNDAKDKIKKKTSEEIAKATGMPNLPFDIKLPF